MPSWIKYVRGAGDSSAMFPHSRLLRNAFIMSLLLLLVFSQSYFRNTAFSALTSFKLLDLIRSPAAPSDPDPIQSALPTSTNSGSCTTHDQPNPIASVYPYNVTGVLNVTLAIVPIPLADARAIIPSQYTILESAYRIALPSFPEGMYPLLIQAGHDHDLHLTGYDISDFSVSSLFPPIASPMKKGYTKQRVSSAPASNFLI